MKLVNETVYNSDDLRALLAFLCAAHHCRKDKVIRIVYSRRGGGIGGWAHYGGVGAPSRRKPGVVNVEAKVMTIALPGPSFPWPRPLVEGEHNRYRADIIHFAQVFEHELAHNRGSSHRDMSKDLLWCKQAVPAGTEAFQLRRECEQPVARAAAPAAPLSAVMSAGEVASVNRSISAHVREAAKEGRTKAAQKREEKVRAKLAAAEGKLKRLEKRVAELRTKVRYYDRKKGVA